MQHCSSVMRSLSITFLLIIMFVLLSSAFLWVLVFWYWVYWYWGQALNAGYEAACPSPCMLTSSLTVFLKRWRNSAWIFPRGKQLSLFFSLCVVAATDLCFKVILFYTRGQWHGKGFMVCLWLLKAFLASWRCLSDRVGCERKHVTSKIN